MLHAVCTTGTKIMHKKDTKICYCPEGRTNPEAFEVAGQENQVRRRAEQNSQLPHCNPDILDLEIPFSKQFNSLQLPKKKKKSWKCDYAPFVPSSCWMKEKLLCWPPFRWEKYSWVLGGEKEIGRQLLWSGDLHSSQLPAGWEGAGSTGRLGPGTACLVGLPCSYRCSMPRLTERLSKNNTDLSREREIEANWTFLSLSPFWLSVVWTRTTFCAPLLPPRLLVW